jgi:hypothetical protein
MRLVSAALALVVAIAATGCGSAPTGAKKPTDGLPEQPVLKPIAPPSSDDLDDKKAIEFLKEQAPTVNTLKARAHTWQKVPDGTLDYCNSDYFVKRSGPNDPYQFAAYVHDAKDKRTIKTKLIFDGRSTIRLRTFFLGFVAVKATLPVNDSRLVDPYGRTMKDSSLDQMLGVLLHPEAKTKKVGAFSLRGEGLQLIEIQSPNMWKDVSKEIFGISDRTGMPIYRDTYNKAGKVFKHMDIENLQVRVKFSGSEFTLD